MSHDKEYRKNYYLKNKEKWERYYKNQITDPEKHKKRNQTTKQWKIKNPEKTKLQKKKDDALYHSKRKQDPEYLQKRRDAATEYNNRPEVKLHRREINAKRRAKPEVKKKNANYNRMYHLANPDKQLENNKRQLQKLGEIHNMSWFKFLHHLRGWAQIIHKDCNETCQICFSPSQEAHHIFHKTNYPFLAFNRNNGIALCTRCHNQVHGKRLLESIV